MFWTIDQSKLYNEVLEDVKEFVKREILLYRKVAKSADLERSSIGNIYSFEISEIDTERGFQQIQTLLSNAPYDQWISKRYTELALFLYTKYGNELMKKLRKSIIKSLCDVYTQIDKGVFLYLDQHENRFWLVPLIKEAYVETMFVN